MLTFSLRSSRTRGSGGGGAEEASNGLTDAVEAVEDAGPSAEFVVRDGLGALSAAALSSKGFDAIEAEEEGGIEDLVWTMGTREGDEGGREKERRIEPTEARAERGERKR